MKFDYANDAILSEYLESLKEDLYSYYETHYANKHTPTQMSNTPQTPASSTVTPHSPQKNFTAHFQRKTTTILNELDEYLSFHLKILRGAILYTGGWVDMLSFLTFFGLCMIFSVYLVHR